MCKSEILNYCSKNFKPIADIYGKDGQGKDLVHLLIYAVSFFRDMELYKLENAVNKN